MSITKDYWAILANIYAPGADPDSEEALTPGMLDLYKQLNVQYQKTTGKFLEEDTKRKIARLKAGVDLVESTNKSITDIIDARTRASVATSKNITARLNTLDDNATKLKQKLQSSDPAYAEQIRAEAAKYTDQGTKRATLIGAATTTFEIVDGIDPGGRDSTGTLNQVLLETVGAGLQDDNIVDIVREEMGDSAYANRVVSNIAARKADYDEAYRLIEFNDEVQKGGEAWKQAMRGTAAGSPEARAANERLAEQIESLDRSLGVTEGLAAMNLESSSAIEAFNQARKEAFDTTGQQSEVLKEIEDRLLGDSKAAFRKEVIESEAFRKWAKSNGYENLGSYRTMEVGGDLRTVYNEGPDDTKAIALYQWQQDHPNMVRPGVSRVAATDTVRAYEKPVSDDALLRYAQVDGKFVKRGDKYVSAFDDAAVLMIEPHIPVEVDGDRDNTYYVAPMSDEESAAYDRVVAAWKQARREGNSERAESILDRIEATQMERPVYRVDKQGNVSRVMDTETIVQVQESFSDKDDKPIEGAAFVDNHPLYNVSDKPPKETVLVEVGPLHSADIEKGEIVQKGRDPYGSYIALDPDTYELTAEAKKAADIPRLRPLTLEEELAKGLAKERDEPFKREKPLDRMTIEDRKERRERRKEERQAFSLDDAAEELVDDDFQLQLPSMTIMNESLDEQKEFLGGVRDKAKKSVIEDAAADAESGNLIEPARKRGQRVLLSDDALDFALDDSKEQPLGVNPAVDDETKVNVAAQKSLTRTDGIVGKRQTELDKLLKARPKLGTIAPTPFDEDAQKAFDDLDLPVRSYR